MELSELEFAARYAHQADRRHRTRPVPRQVTRIHPHGRGSTVASQRHQMSELGRRCWSVSMGPPRSGFTRTPTRASVWCPHRNVAARVAGDSPLDCGRRCSAEALRAVAGGPSGRSTSGAVRVEARTVSCQKAHRQGCVSHRIGARTRTMIERQVLALTDGPTRCHGVARRRAIRPTLSSGACRVRRWLGCSVPSPEMQAVIDQLWQRQKETRGTVPPRSLEEYSSISPIGRLVTLPRRHAGRGLNHSPTE